MPQIWHHYTTADGFFGIIKNKCIWASHASNMNDPDDCSIDHKLIQKIATENIKDSEIRNTFLAFLERPIVPFITSFTDDADALVHWRAYADDARGLALGFCPHELIGKKPSEDPIHLDVNEEKDLLLMKMRYGDEAWREGALKSSCEFLMRNISSGSPINDSALMASIVARIYFYASKSQHYRDERELRLVSIGGSGVKPSFRISRGLLTSHIEIPLSTSCSALKEVTLGPRCLFSACMVEEFLASEGFEGVAVRKTHINYR